jgi:hypothetical protein
MMIMPRTSSLILLFALLTTGCRDANSKKSTDASASKVKEQAQTYAKEWTNMGMWLPNAEQLSFFSANIDITKDILADTLADQNNDVRQRAAYVIEKIGPAAKPMQAALVTALAKEKVPLVRIYLCNALSATGDANDDALTQLRVLFHAPADDKDTLDQRIYSAAALSTLSQNPKEVLECTAFVCQWLKPPSKDLVPSELEKYWDLRWSAVNAVEHMTQAKQAIPLLDKMLTEPDKRDWVDMHVPRALAALGTSTPHTNQPPPNHTKWTPPANPDPQKILNEAQTDMIAGRYEEALAKHVWFYGNALKIDPALYGVRLSFALMYWKQLSIVYPPAKAKLIEIRDEAEKKVTSGEDIRESFHDVESINSVLGEDKKTAALFGSLDKKDGKVAAQVFDVARPALIRAGQIKMCSKYVDAKNDYPRLVQMYREHLKLAADPKFGQNLKEFGQQSFSNGVATLVALLAVSDRKAEAETIATDAKTVWSDKAFADVLDKALKGNVPEPWPFSTN